MTKTKKQLYLLCDLEGASQISPENKMALRHGSEAWQADGRRYLTSDILAVCEAAIEYGIDEIVINDEHDFGKRESNLLVDQLPEIAHVLKRPSLPGHQTKHVKKDVVGMIIVGQHAMYNGGGFAAHTIQSPPIANITLNGKPMGEIGLEMALFPGVKLLAIFGEEAAVQEARGLCPTAAGCAVKSLEKNWFPAIQETHDMIKQKTLEALCACETARGLEIEAPFRFGMRLTEGCHFDFQGGGLLAFVVRFFFFRIFRGKLIKGEASWETKRFKSGLNVLHMLKTIAKPLTS